MGTGTGGRLKRTSACLQMGESRLHAQATSYLVTAWEALASQQETTIEELPVSFEDVSIVQAVQAQPGEAVTLSVLLDRSHRFQVCAVMSDTCMSSPQAFSTLALCMPEIWESFIWPWQACTCLLSSIWGTDFLAKLPGLEGSS